MQSDRRGQATSTLRSVQARHEEIQKITKQMGELSQMFQQMNQLVVTQEPVVTRIAEQSENVQTDVTNANVELGTAIKSARARNRKKWWCLLIARKHTSHPWIVLAMETDFSIQLSSSSSLLSWWSS